MNPAFLPLITTTASFVFAIVMLDQYFAGRKSYQLVWTVSLFIYAIGAGTEFWTGFWGLSDVPYRLWYLFGAVYGSSFMGMSTIYLMVKQRIANILMIVLLLASIYPTYLVLTVPLSLAGMTRLTGSAIPESVRLMTPLFNGFGVLALMGGALVSVWQYRKRRVMRDRVVSSVTIAIASLLPGAAGVYIKTGGYIEVFFICELTAIIIIFAGLLKNKEIFGVRRFPLVHGFGKTAARADINAS